MIVKQVPNRHDGKSDFGELARYITGGIGVDEHAKAVRERPGFGPLTEYVAQAHGKAGQDKCVAVSLHRIRSVATAAAQFHSVAMRNPNVENPVVHLIVSWPEHERPSYDAIFAAGRDVLKALNLHDHQSLMAIHNDTDNLHCHIEVSRVHPDTYKSQHLPWMHRTLHRAAREIEIRNGWFHDDGLFVVQTLPDGRKAVVPNTSYRDAPDIDRSLRGEKAQRMGAWSDKPSLVQYCREMVKDEMARLLDSAAGWDAAHQLLGEHGMRIHKIGAGAFQLEAINEAGSAIRLPISLALRGVKLGEAERVMGPFTPNRTAVTAVVKSSMSDRRQEGSAPPRRDPFRREARRLERAAERSTLIGRYRAAEEAAKSARSATGEQLAEVAARCQAKIDAQRMQTAAAKEALFQDEPDSHERKLRRRDLTIEARLDRLIVKAEAKARCESIRASRPAPLAWRTWLEAEAQAGDPAALKALRGLVYDAGRKGRKQARAGSCVDRNAVTSLQGEDGADAVLAGLLAHEKEEASIRSAQFERARVEQADALLNRIRGLTWRVTNNGNVEYRRATGEPVFVDKGTRLTFDRQAVTDQDLALTMLHAREKWGNTIVLTGGDAIFVERMVKAAVSAGMTVRNPELQPVQARYIALQARNGKKHVMPNAVSGRSGVVGFAPADLQTLVVAPGSAPVETGSAALSGATPIKTVQKGRGRRG
ncbi:TraI/MobA(P) family conjugative relaxase [Paraburkholderia sp. FT54]|uniref:TraI/MobA(P) family conjugative relaxase n=1 Tax=Paraburkholderia sp. FT54 TaxID=3074437 RepID=UPI0028779C30|nr:TraI/MobA(P) family conjugative relaxase [Paraburkholderia sp. FT54]WNC89601.1 TraI/MobA(P) family conjugative relaxase [Paraburkholderia sp. FT54]